MVDKWVVIAYEDKKGGKPIESFITSLPKAAIPKLMHVINLLSAHGYRLKQPHAKQINNELYELRVRGKHEVRVFYAYRHNRIYLLHGFIKKSQKTPNKEIVIATGRLKSCV